MTYHKASVSEVVVSGLKKSNNLPNMIGWASLMNMSIAVINTPRYKYSGQKVATRALSKLGLLLRFLATSNCFLHFLKQKYLMINFFNKIDNKDRNVNSYVPYVYGWRLMQPFRYSRCKCKRTEKFCAGPFITFYYLIIFYLCP